MNKWIEEILLPSTTSLLRDLPFIFFFYSSEKVYYVYMIQIGLLFFCRSFYFKVLTMCRMKSAQCHQLIDIIVSNITASSTMIAVHM